MESLEQKQADLFERWKSEREYTNYISDGIFDFNVWQNEPLKTLC